MQNYQERRLLQILILILINDFNPLTHAVH